MSLPSVVCRRFSVVCLKGVFFNIWSLEDSRCHSDMGILAFLASPSPVITLVIRASHSHTTLAIWVRVRVRGDAHITSRPLTVLEMGMPKTR